MQLAAHKQGEYDPITSAHRQPIGKIVDEHKVVDKKVVNNKIINNKFINNKVVVNHKLLGKPTTAHELSVSPTPIYTPHVDKSNHVGGEIYLN